jgi:hypothetical protein
MSWWRQTCSSSYLPRLLFRHLADQAKIGTVFRLANNRDGIVTVQLAELSFQIKGPSLAEFNPEED